MNFGILLFWVDFVCGLGVFGVFLVYLVFWLG